MGLVIKLRHKAKEEVKGQSYALVLAVTVAIQGILIWAVMTSGGGGQPQRLSFEDASQSTRPQGDPGPPGPTGPAGQTGPAGMCIDALQRHLPLEASCIPPTVRFETIEGLKEQYLDSIAFEGKIKRHNNR